MHAEVIIFFKRIEENSLLPGINCGENHLRQPIFDGLAVSTLQSNQERLSKVVATLAILHLQFVDVPPSKSSRPFCWFDRG